MNKSMFLGTPIWAEITSFVARLSNIEAHQLHSDLHKPVTFVLSFPVQHYIRPFIKTYFLLKWYKIGGFSLEARLQDQTSHVKSSVAKNIFTS